MFGTAFPGVLQRIGGDNDADGVPDVLDTCAETPPNVAVDDAGCIISEADSDGDGVVDAQDLCPLTRSNEPVDDAGCAARQRDGDDDGVNDLEDDCPSSTLGSTVDAYGCVVEDGGADTTNETNTTSDTNNSEGTNGIENGTEPPLDEEDPCANPPSDEGAEGEEKCPIHIDPAPANDGFLPWPGAWLAIAVCALAAFTLSRKPRTI